MTSNDNQLMPPSNIWTHFLSGRLNPPRHMMMPMVPPNMMFPYLPINRDMKHMQPEMQASLYSMETMHLLRSMLQRQSQMPPMSPMAQNPFQKNTYVPQYINQQQPNENLFSRSPGSSHVTSPVEKVEKVFHNGEMSGYENGESKQSDLSSMRCPVCSEVVSEYDLEVHFHQELRQLVDIPKNSPKRLYKESDSLDQSSHWKSKLPFQTSISRYRNFEKIKINRVHRRVSGSCLPSNGDLKGSLGRVSGEKVRQNSQSDFSVSSKKAKTSFDTIDHIDLQ